MAAGPSLSMDRQVHRQVQSAVLPVLSWERVCAGSLYRHRGCYKASLCWFCTAITFAALSLSASARAHVVYARSVCSFTAVYSDVYICVSSFVIHPPVHVPVPVLCVCVSVAMSVAVSISVSVYLCVCVIECFVGVVSVLCDVSVDLGYIYIQIITTSR